MKGTKRECRNWNHPQNIVAYIILVFIGIAVIMLLNYTLSESSELKYYREISTTQPRTSEEKRCEQYGDWDQCVTAPSNYKCMWCWDECKYSPEGRCIGKTPYDIQQGK